MWLWMIPNRASLLDAAQITYIKQGIAKTQGTVPMLQRTEVELIENIFVMQRSIPIGMLTKQPYNPDEHGRMRFVEIGVRFWDVVPTMPVIVSAWLDKLLEEYEYATATVYANNKRVKPLLQRGGFNLIRIDKMTDLEGRQRTIEVYGVSRQTFMGRHPATMDDMIDGVFEKLKEFDALADERYMQNRMVN